MLNYGLMVDKGSMFNTPNTFGIYALERMFAWMEKLGGLVEIERINKQKSDLLYGNLDSTEFWRTHAFQNSRSQMNVTWRSPSAELASADAEGLKGLKGHRSVGGIRASIYNACPLVSVRVLVDFMNDFVQRNG